MANSIPTTYLALTGVLACVLVVTMWRGGSSSRTGVFFAGTTAALAFLVSRIIAVVFTTTLATERVYPPLLYMVLNFLCVFLASYTILQMIEEAEKTVAPIESDSGEAAGAWGDEGGREGLLTSVRNRAAVWGVIGVVAYWLLPTPGRVGYSVTGFVDMVMLLATVGVLYYLVGEISRTVRPVRLMFLPPVIALATSWVLVLLASYGVGRFAATALHLSRTADIVALAFGLMAVQADYVTLGSYLRNLARRSQEEAEKAKTELNLLSRVASDIYEDSSSMIQRQQDHSRDLMRRIESLERLLQIGVKIQRTKSLKELLQMVAELVRDDLGFKTVIVRLLNERTQSFETKAYVGLNPDLHDTVMSHRLSVAEYEQLIEPRFRISNSYFLRNIAPADQADGEGAEEQVLLSDGWSDIDRVIVPLRDEEERTIGYLSVEDPVDAGRSIVNVIEGLETIATLSVIAIRNAEFYRSVSEKNEKLKLYAEKLSGLNKMKSNFVATISHEFRTPLTSIKAYCETLLKNADHVDRKILKEFLVVIDEESDRLMTLIEDILDFSQMESGAIKFERSPCNLNETVKAAAKEMERSFERKNIHLDTDMPDEPVMVRAERELMKQLVVNLLHNASKFTPENGHVWVHLEDESSSARVVVEDDGIGVPEEELERIFDHFHQVDNTATRQYGGSGLGLAICKNIVDWHDGKIWVENVEGRGARFVAIIPKKQVLVRSHVVNAYGALRRYELERYLELIVEMVAELLSVKKASIMTLDSADEELRIDCAIGLDEEIVEHARVKVGEGIAGRVAAEKRAILVEDIDADGRIGAKNNDYLYDSRSFISVPILRQGHVLGVINASNPMHKERFDWNDCRLLATFASRVANALGTLRTFTGTYGDFESVRATLKAMLDVKRYIEDKGAGAIAVVISDVANDLGLSSEEAATLQYAFNVYDLGLASVGYNIVKQPKRLSQEERRDVEQHTVVGTELLGAIEHSTAVRDAVLYHHENYDGTGYPSHLAGEEIPLAARILRVADSFRALVSNRPYQKRYAISEAIEVLKHRSGTFFDPEIVRSFVEVVERRRDLFEETQETQHAKRSVDAVRPK